MFSLTKNELEQVPLQGGHHIATACFCSSPNGQSGTSKSLSSFVWLPEITGLEDEEEKQEVAVS